MQSPPRKQPRRGIEAFASRDFRRFQLARVAAVLGYAAQSVAVAWQVYSITHRAIDLGYTGLVQFLPGLLFLLPAGHAAAPFHAQNLARAAAGRLPHPRLSPPPMRGYWSAPSGKIHCCFSRKSSQALAILRTMLLCRASSILPRTCHSAYRLSLHIAGIG